MNGHRLSLFVWIKIYIYTNTYAKLVRKSVPHRPPGRANAYFVHNLFAHSITV